MNKQDVSRAHEGDWQALTVGQLVVRYPQAARVFERHGIDYCCGGKRSLEEAGARKGLPVETLRADLAAALAGGVAPIDSDWQGATLGSLIDHVESTHHEYIRAEKPRLQALAHKVARVHGSRHPELVDLSAAVDQLFSELEPHLDKEEQVFFPAFRKWEAGAPGTAPSSFLADGLAALEEEHFEVGRILESIRELTAGFQPPMDACNSYHALFHGLEEFEADLHEHIHEENNVLHARIGAAVGRTGAQGAVEGQGRQEGAQPGHGPKRGGASSGSCCEA